MSRQRLWKLKQSSLKRQVGRATRKKHCCQNTFTALTLASVPVTNADLDSVLRNLKNVVTVTTASLGAEVEFTLRPRNSRPRIVECQETNTFTVNFLLNTPLQRGVEVETVLLSMQAGIVTLAPVQEEDEDGLRRSMLDEIDVGALTPAPRERSPLPSYDPHAGIALLIPVPDFHQMADDSDDNMMADARVSREAVEMKHPMGIANIRSKRTESVPMVTRERTTYSKYVVPPPSNYVLSLASLPMLPDPALQDSFKEDLTYSENKELAKIWQRYSSMKQPTIRAQ